ncbi:MAG: GspE/PulE family protein [Patescibacteria group bacterium]
MTEPVQNSPVKVPPISPPSMGGNVVSSVLAPSMSSSVSDPSGSEFSEQISVTGSTESNQLPQSSQGLGLGLDMAAGNQSISPEEVESLSENIATQLESAGASADAPVVIVDQSSQTSADSSQNPGQSEVGNLVSTSSPTNPKVASDSDGQSNTVGQKTVVEVLLEKNLLSQADVVKINQEHLSTGKAIEDILRDQQQVSEETITKAKAEIYNIPYIKISETGMSPEAINKVDESVARRYKLFPFAWDKQNNSLNVAMENPMDLVAIDFIRQKTGCEIIPFYAMPSELDRVIAERYSQNLSSEVTQALQEAPQEIERRRQQQDLSELSGGVVRAAPINRIVETILDFAMRSRASDVHIEPLIGRTRVRYRIDGILTERLILPKTVHDAVVSRIKILTNLKIDEKRIPQDGRFNYASDNQEVDLRVSTLPTIHGEKVVMRLLKKDVAAPTLEELGLTGMALRDLREAIKVPHGIVLVTGPTGSGKTTTLYSVLHIINTAKVNIMTLEDPVEYQVPGVNQVQINPQAGLTFANGLRSFLRQDPNIIMVGEIRDSETAELAIQASLTGHLVFSTLHTNSAAGALPRLLDMGAEPFLLASSMTLAMAQRVVRKINQDYREEYKPDEAVINDVKQVLGEKFDSWCKQHNKKPDEITLFRPKEDRPHTEPEYKGRIGIYEVMKITEEISHLIMERRPAGDLEKVAVKNGMLFMKQDGYIKALDGLTTIEEVKRVAEV